MSAYDHWPLGLLNLLLVKYKHFKFKMGKIIKYIYNFLSKKSEETNDYYVWLISWWCSSKLYWNLLKHPWLNLNCTRSNLNHITLLSYGSILSFDGKRNERPHSLLIPKSSDYIVDFFFRGPSVGGQRYRVSNCLDDEAMINSVRNSESPSEIPICNHCHRIGVN